MNAPANPPDPLPSSPELQRPWDILALKSVSERYREALERLPEPELDLRQRPAGVASWLAGPCEAA